MSAFLPIPPRGRARAAEAFRELRARLLVRKSVPMTSAAGWRGPGSDGLLPSPAPHSRAALFRALMVVATAMALITTAEGAFYRAGRGDAIALPDLLLGRLADWYSCALLIPPLYWVTARVPIGWASLRMAVPIHLAATSAASLLKFVLYVPLHGLIDPSYELTIGEAIYFDFLGKLMFFWGVSAILHALVFYERSGTQAATAVTRGKPRDPSPAAADGLIAVSDGAATRFIRHEEIEWIEAQGNYATIHMAGGDHMIRETMHGLARRLDGNCFLRIHRSAIVNVAAIKLAVPAPNGRYRLQLRSGIILMTGRKYKPALADWIGRSNARPAARPDRD